MPLLGFDLHSAINVHIVLVEDDAQLGQAIRDALVGQSHTVTWLRTGHESQLAVREQSADLMLLDLGLPDMDGLDVLAAVRRDSLVTPIMVITARDELDSRVKGLDLGADDYLVKPFDLDELAARIRSLLRRTRGLTNSIVEASGLRLNLATLAVEFQGKAVTLARREIALLRMLMERAGCIARREDLENLLYGIESDIDSNALEVQIHSLRKKLSAEVIRTVRGVGYMIPADRRLDS
jgi:two-component system response regulator QseB